VNEPMSNKDQIILDALERQRKQQMETLRNGYRAVAKFHAQMYQATRQLLNEDWAQVMGAFAGRDEIWTQYAVLLDKSVDDLTDEERIRALIEARPTWPWEHPED